MLVSGSLFVSITISLLSLLITGLNRGSALGFCFLLLVTVVKSDSVFWMAAAVYDLVFFPPLAWAEMMSVLGFFPLFGKAD